MFLFFCLFCFWKGFPPALKKRMLDKSCFNFTSVNEVLLAELAELTRSVIEFICILTWT